VPELLAPDRVDWRWARIVELSQYSDTEALPRLKKEDEVTRRAFKFKRAFDKGLGDDYPEFNAAHYIYVNKHHTRHILEALLLAGASNSKILEYVWADVEDVIQAYHDLFFCVRAGLNKPAWICSTVFGGLPHQNVHQLDKHGIFLRLAWYGGLTVAEELIRGGTLTEEVRMQLRDVMKDALLRSATETALTLTSRSDQAPELLRITLDSSEEDAGAKIGEYERAVADFMGDLSITVANPKDERNLSLPAREELDVEYEVINDGRDKDG
jgi:hypothetical protein